MKYVVELLDPNGNVIEGYDVDTPVFAQAVLEDLARRLIAYDDPETLEGDGSFVPGTLTWYEEEDPE